ncbi:unnamed protein product [Penicillium roqueforti FM164]|uniref:Genomic scaffold, ProqFM164S02 n=1 Tax=Penicillium roqueforti (strain FM164) TaxID=1365484 RepID=W6QDF2_PENRF|nr:unnamed protein product [Penicillium roqueforti FM164]
MWREAKTILYRSGTPRSQDPVPRHMLNATVANGRARTWQKM